MKKHTLTIILTTLLILIDQISKYFFYNQNILNNIKIFHASFNTWISRSLAVPQIITIILTLIILWYLTYLYLKNKISKRVIIFLIAWAIWNLIDRIYLWWVRDFISLFNRFPIFNIADISINIWVIIIIYHELFNIKKYNKWKSLI